MAKKVVGLDLSMTGTGVAHTQVDDRACTHLLVPEGRGDFRLASIRFQVKTYIAGAELVLIEEWLVQSATAPITGMVHGVVRTALMELEIPYTTVPPTTLKKYATGRGNATKTQMAVAAFKRADLEFDDDNQCDAWWLWVMARDLSGDPVLELPQDHRIALEKVAKHNRETLLGVLDGNMS